MDIELIGLVSKSVGALGLVLITSGVLVSNDEKKENTLFLIGGLALLVYSSYLQDPIFVPLQIIFIIASAYALYKLKKSASKK